MVWQKRGMSNAGTESAEEIFELKSNAASLCKVAPPRKKSDI